MQLQHYLDHQPRMMSCCLPTSLQKPKFGLWQFPFLHLSVALLLFSVMCLQASMAAVLAAEQPQSVLELYSCLLQLLCSLPSRFPILRHRLGQALQWGRFLSFRFSKRVNLLAVAFAESMPLFPSSEGHVLEFLANKETQYSNSHNTS